MQPPFSDPGTPGDTPSESARAESVVRLEGTAGAGGPAASAVPTPAEAPAAQSAATPGTSADAAAAAATAATAVTAAGATGTRDPLARLRWIGAGVAGLIALLLVFSWMDSRNRVSELRLELAKRAQQAEQIGRENQKVARDALEMAGDMQSKITLLETRLADAQSQQAALEELYRELTPGRDDWTIAEAEQVLLLASQQLQLAGNVRGALTALQLADSKLQRADRPQFTPLRRALARDMERLKALPFTDVTGMSLRLDQAIAAVEKLPLAIEERVPPTEPEIDPKDDTRLRRLAREIWTDLRQMIRLENMQRREVPLLGPTQEYFLRENLKLRFLSARLALISRDEGAFRSDMKSADEWLRRYFDPKAKPTQALLVVVKQLASTEMPGEMPDLNASLDAVRSLKAVRERSVR